MAITRSAKKSTGITMLTHNRKAAVTIYSDPTCPLSHRTRIAIHEKNIDANIIDLNSRPWPDNVAAINPSGIGPSLVDHNVTLFDTNIINGYLDERFLQPTLMPNDPASRAQARLMLLRFDTDWYAHWDELTGQVRGKTSRARKALQEDLTVLAPLFAEYPFFMSKNFSLLDCSLAPLLWRLPSLNIKLSASAKSVEDYATRVFARESFQASLSDAERAMRQ